MLEILPGQLSSRDTVQNLTAYLALAESLFARRKIHGLQKNEHPLANAEGVHTRLVAGAGNRRYLHLNYVVI